MVHFALFARGRGRFSRELAGPDCGGGAGGGCVVGVEDFG